MTQIEKWIAGYIKAWNSNDQADIEALFTEDADYYEAPYDEPHQGRAAIAAWWLTNQDKPGSASFDWHPIVVTDEVAVIQGTATYPTRTYSNIWVLRLDGDGRCREFTEWFMKHPALR